MDVGTDNHGPHVQVLGPGLRFTQVHLVFNDTENVHNAGV